MEDKEWSKNEGALDHVKEINILLIMVWYISMWFFFFFLLPEQLLCPGPVLGIEYNR